MVKKEWIFLKKYVLTLLLSALSAILFYLLEYETVIKTMANVTIILGLLLSGTAVSGDRMRANTTGEGRRTKNLYLYVLLFAIPYVLLLLFG